MKQAMIYKGYAPEEISTEDLTKINHYTRRELTTEELYVFPLTLCDNEIDRDYERFSTDALHKLRRLFLGKTGIFDHNPKGENQTARIFATAVEKDELRKTATGEVYHFLTAKAYMVRSEKNKDLILDIDAGIKKEVSIGCAVERVCCSVCGADVKKQPCAHKNGKTYEGTRCHYVLESPADAYEWSFVAVPAQPAAGVTKAYETALPVQGQSTTRGHVLEKLRTADTGLTLSTEDLNEFRQELALLSEKVKAGEDYRAQLIGEVLRCAALSQTRISQKAIVSIAQKLDIEELRELRKSFLSTGRDTAPQVQLGGGSPMRPGENTQFLI